MTALEPEKTGVMMVHRAVRARGIGQPSAAGFRRRRRPPPVAELTFSVGSPENHETVSVASERTATSSRKRGPQLCHCVFEIEA